MTNIAEILKDCPNGTKLYSPLCGECYFDSLNYGTIICTKQNTQEITFTSEGYYMLPVFDDSEPVLFPSKENRDWSTFQRPFKDGDVVISDKGDIHLLRTEDSSYCAYRERWNGLPKFDSTITTSVKVVRHATEEEKKKLFDVINENGYKWNSETKSLENLEKVFELKFKVGDRVQNKNTNMIGTINLIINDEREYQVALKNGGITYILFELQDSWELVKDNNIKPKFKVGDKIKSKVLDIVNPIEITAVTPRIYTFTNGSFQKIEIIDKDYELINEPKFKIGDRIKHKLTGEIYIILHVISNGYGGGVYDVAITNEIGKSIDIKEQDSYELVPDKFDISTLKPFDKVLVRNTYAGRWCGQFYQTYDENEDEYPFECTYDCWKQCVPYEGNEHLRGTTDDCDDFYKNW